MQKPTRTAKGAHRPMEINWHPKHRYIDELGMYDQRQHQKKISYLLNILKFYQAYHNQQLTGQNYPFITGIEVTNKCNLNCSFCNRETVEKQETGFMTDETFHKIVNAENAPMLRHIGLYNHGEPLLHPKLCEYIKEASKYAKTISLATNATLLTKEYGERLLRSGLTQIHLSFEGITKQIYESLRKGANYDQTLRNIFEFIVTHKKLRSLCKVYIGIVDIPETHNHLPEFVKFWNRHGVCVDVAREHGWSKTGTRKQTCTWPWWGMIIRWNGEVLPCPVYEEAGSFGNIHDQSITEIWQNKNYQAFREKMLNGTVCRECRTAQDVTDPYLCFRKPEGKRGELKALNKLLTYSVGLVIHRNAK